jgi:uncharacterized protein YbjT (DUF2867 family)
MEPDSAMKVLLFGASGMVGRGVLRECLLAPDVAEVTAIVRKPTGVTQSRYSEIVLGDLFAIATIEDRLAGYDACFFCAGVSSAGMSERDYTKATYDLTLTVAESVARRNVDLTFVYVTGMGADSTEKGRVMWARVKGRTENALLRLPFKAAFMFRPGIIELMHGVASKTGWYRAFYTMTGPLLPLVRRVFPNAITTTQAMGRAMLAVVRYGYEKPILETPDINRAALLGEDPSHSMR